MTISQCVWAAQDSSRWKEIVSQVMMVKCQISSSSLACPVIWDRRYTSLVSSSILPCLLRCPLSFSPACVVSLLHASFHLRFGSFFFFSLVCPHLAFFSLCAPVSFCSHGRTTTVVVLSFSWTLVPLLLFFWDFLLFLSLYCVHFGYHPFLSLRTSISAASSHLILVALIVLSLLPMSVHHTTELVNPVL